MQGIQLQVGVMSAICDPPATHGQDVRYIFRVPPSRPHPSDASPALSALAFNKRSFREGSLFPGVRVTLVTLVTLVTQLYQLDGTPLFPRLLLDPLTQLYGIS